MGWALLDLGSHRLKDLQAPEHLYQVQVGGCRRGSAARRSLGRSVPPPDFGDAADRPGRAEFDLSGRTAGGPGAARLLTLTGLGGTGKTRLAVELARHHVDDFPNGVHFVALADARTVEQMWTAISESVGVSPGVPTVAELLAHLETSAA